MTQTGAMWFVATLKVVIEKVILTIYLLLLELLVYDQEMWKIETLDSVIQTHLTKFSQSIQNVNKTHS